jgi:hypothetical protein
MAGAAAGAGLARSASFSGRGLGVLQDLLKGKAHGRSELSPMGTKEERTEEGGGGLSTSKPATRGRG